MADSLLISVVICTYNRAAYLGNAIQSILEQTLDPAHFELIVVDNNSTDGTRAVVGRFTWASFPVRYVFEATQGLSHARNRGWREARGVYVAYLDDDAKAPKHWLALAKDIIDAHMPAVIGGPYREFFQSGRPVWFKDEYLVNWGSLEQAGPLTKRYAFGSNMFCRRDDLALVDGFKADFGMTGGKIAYYEEIEFQQRLLRARPDAMIYGSSELYIWHLKRAEKAHWRWLIPDAIALGRDREKLRLRYAEPEQIKPVGELIRIGQNIIGFVVDCVRGVVSRDKVKYPRIQNYIYEHGLLYLRNVGQSMTRYASVMRRGR